MAKELSKLIVSLEAESSRLQKELDKANNRFKKWERQATKSVDGVKSSFLLLGAAFAAIKAGTGIINIAVDFERLQTTLKSVTGTAQGAEAALGFIRDFASTTPFQVKELTDTFIKLKAFGLEPTSEVMQAIADQASLLGGESVQLTGITLALGQAWAKQKLQGEEILQLVERGVPVWELLSKTLNKSTAEIQKMSEKGELGRDAISGLIAAMGDKAMGAAVAQAQTLGGAFSNFSDTVDKIIDKLANEGGLSDALARAVTHAADLMSTLAGTRTSGQVQREMNAIQYQIDLITQKSIEFQKVGRPIPPGFVQQVAFYQNQLKKLNKEYLALQATAKKNSKLLEGGKGVETIPAETAAAKKAREQAEKEKDLLNKQVDALALSLLDKETLEADSWFRRQGILDNAQAAKLISDERHKTLTEQLEAKHLKTLAKIRIQGLTKLEQFNAMSWQGQTQTIAGELANMTAGVAQSNKKMFQINKIAGIANAVINTARGITNALGSYPPPVSFVMAGLQAAAGLAQIAAIKSTTFGGGGGAPSIAGSGGGAPSTVNTLPATNNYETAEANEPIVINIQAHDASGFNRLLKTERSTIVQMVRDAQTARGRQATV